MVIQVAPSHLHVFGLRFRPKDYPLTPANVSRTLSVRGYGRTPFRAEDGPLSLPEQELYFQLRVPPQVIAESMTAIDSRKYHPEMKIRIKQIIVIGENDTFLTPCGNCREILVSRASPEGRIFIKPTVFKRMWMPIQALLPKAEEPLLEFEQLAPIQKAMIGAAIAKQQGAYTPFMHESGVGALLFDDKAIIAASAREDASYFHGMPLEVALDAADSDRKRGIISAVFVKAADGEFPASPDGRSRQKLYEAAEVSGKDEGLEVVLYNPNSRKAVVTTIGALLPYPFGPKNLGIDVSKYR